METWLKDLVKETNNILYSHWAALGANVVAEPCRRAVVDPEAALVATCAFGRYDARIFDEAMDWTISNHRLLKPWRLKRICADFGADTTRCLAAVLAFVSQGQTRQLFPGVIQQARGKLRSVQEDALFFNERKIFQAGKRETDPIFLAWKLLRSQPRIREHSGSPDMENPANLMTRLRSYFGTGTKGDVVTYLITGGAGSSNAIASKIKYNQKSVYDALEELVESGMAFKRGGRGSAEYWADPYAIANSLGLKGKRPVFYVWGDLLRALHMVADDVRQNTEGWSSPFFSAERSKDLMVKVARLVRASGEPLRQIPLPDIRKLRGSDHNLELKRFLDRTLSIISDIQ